MRKIRLMTHREATLRGWVDRVSRRDSIRSRRHGAVYQDVITVRIGGGSVSAAAFREFYPDPAVPYIDESNIGKGSIGNGAGTVTIDFILNRSKRPMKGGGVAGQIKMSGRKSTEVSLCTGNLSTVRAVVKGWREHWVPNGLKFVLVLVDGDAPNDPRDVQVRQFALLELTSIARLNHKYANADYPGYDWDSDAQVHVRDPLAKGRGVACKSPLRVVWTTRNKSKRKYAKLVLSLTHPEVAPLIRWVDTSDMTHEDAAELLASHVMRMGAR